MNANSVQVGGTHYAGKYQHWDLVADLKLGYFEGQITKYVTRWRKKNGVQDLEKARHFLIKLTELVKVEGWVCTSGFTGWYNRNQNGRSSLDVVSEFCRSNDLTEPETAIVRTTALWSRSLHLDYVLRDLELMIARAKAATPPNAVDEPGAGYINQDR